MPFMNVAGVRLHYQDTGGPGQAVIFSHGLLMDGGMFVEQVEAFVPEYRCITWDQRGFGGTGPAAEPFDYWDSARDLLGLMSGLGIASASLVGLSQGGFLSMRAALLEPERVNSLVLLATRAATDSAETVENFRQLRDEWRRNGAKNVSGPLAEVLLGPDVDPVPWVERWARMGLGDMDLPLRALMERDDLTSKLPDIACPSIVVHGTADKAIDIEHGKHLAQNLPGCSGLHPQEGAGHAVNLARPAAVNAIMTRFLGEMRSKFPTR
ncbi:MAG TPA: alpha/beta hydrolase [Stellaceae bacterium]|nr:alpha/beta hydrolase [Stellaceae bacterium]